MLEVQNFRLILLYIFFCWEFLFHCWSFLFVSCLVGWSYALFETFLSQHLKIFRSLNIFVILCSSIDCLFSLSLCLPDSWYVQWFSIWTQSILEIWSKPVGSVFKDFLMGYFKTLCWICHTCFCFMFWFFGHKACVGICSVQMQSCTLHWKAVLTTGPPEESQTCCFNWLSLIPLWQGSWPLLAWVVVEPVFSLVP